MSLVRRVRGWSESSPQLLEREHEAKGSYHTEWDGIFELTKTAAELGEAIHARVNNGSCNAPNVEDELVPGFSGVERSERRVTVTLPNW